MCQAEAGTQSWLAMCLARPQIFGPLSAALAGVSAGGQISSGVARTEPGAVIQDADVIGCCDIGPDLGQSTTS